MIRGLWALLLAAALITPAFAQDEVETAEGAEDDTEAELSEGEMIEDTFQPQTLAATRGVVLRGLDKITTETTDLEIGVGQTVPFGRLDVRLGECRAPSDNPQGDAYAWLEVTERESGRQVFAGWMIASSPALSAMDHARLDLWVLRCMSS